MEIRASDIFKAVESGRSITWLRDPCSEYGSEYETKIFEIDVAVAAIIEELKQRGISIIDDQKYTNEYGTYEIL